MAGVVAGSPNRYYARVEGYKKLRRELVKLAGDEDGKQLFREYQRDIQGIMNVTLLPIAKNFVPVDTGRLRGSLKVKVLASKIYIQSGPPRMGNQARAMYHGFKKGDTTFKGRYWVYKAWKDTNWLIHQKMVPVMNKYGAMVERKLNVQRWSGIK